MANPIIRQKPLMALLDLAPPKYRHCKLIHLSITYHIKKVNDPLLTVLPSQKSSSQIETPNNCYRHILSMFVHLLNLLIQIYFYLGYACDLFGIGYLCLGYACDLFGIGD